MILSAASSTTICFYKSASENYRLLFVRPIITELISDLLLDYAARLTTQVKKELTEKKNWRWFHCFGFFEPARLMQIRNLHRAGPSPLRAQERYPAGDRRRWKRRRFIHGLAA